MSYPLPSQVLSGVVFGAANELVGTLSPVSAGAVMIRTSQMRTNVTRRSKRSASADTGDRVLIGRESVVKMSVSVVLKTPSVSIFTQPDEITIRTNFETV